MDTAVERKLHEIKNNLDGPIERLKQGANPSAYDKLKACRGIAQTVPEPVNTNETPAQYIHRLNQALNAIVDIVNDYELIIGKGGIMIPAIKPHNNTAETVIEIEGHEIDIRLELEWVPGCTPPKDHIGRHVEPVEAPGYIIIGAEWKSPFDDPAEWEPVPGIMMDIIHKNERELLERADKEVPA